MRERYRPVCRKPAVVRIETEPGEELQIGYGFVGYRRDEESWTMKKVYVDLCAYHDVFVDPCRPASPKEKARLNGSFPRPVSFSGDSLPSTRTKASRR